jgi:hypothetical protein
MTMATAAVLPAGNSFEQFILSEFNRKKGAFVSPNFCGCVFTRYNKALGI